MNNEQKAKILARLLELGKPGGDIEIKHGEADSLLCDALTLLGHEDIVDAWAEVDKWYA